MKTVLEELRNRVPEDYQFEINPVAEFTEQYLNSQPEEAKQLGCNADFNAYTGDENPTPDASKLIRTAAGHLHIGWEDEPNNSGFHFELCRRIIKQMDYFLGIPSIIMDTDSRRRTLYGKAGAFRPKPYGAEYRTLSNFWIKSKDRMEFIFNQAQKGLTSLMDGEDYGAKYGELAQNIINNNSTYEAECFVDRNEWKLP